MKKLLKRVRNEMGIEDEDAVTKKDIRSACKEMPKAHIEDGSAWWGSKKEEEEDVEVEQTEKKRKRVAATPDDTESKTEKTEKTTKTKKEKGKGKEEDLSDKKTKKAKKGDTAGDEKTGKEEKKKKVVEQDQDSEGEKETEKVSSGGWNNWQAANFEDDQRKNKFLRLMGGAKAKGSDASAGNGKKGLFGGLSKMVKPENTHENAIINSGKVTAELENQFNQAFEMKNAGGGKVRGLGFEAAPKKNAWRGSKTSW